MPLAIDIFNKKVLSHASNFGTFNVLLSGDAAGIGISQPVLLNTTNPTININGNTSNSFYGVITGSKEFTYSNIQTGQYIDLYLKADHTGNGVEHTFPSGTFFDKYGTENKIYTHSGYITKVELLNHPYGYLGTSNLIRYYAISTGQPTGAQTDPYSNYVTLLMHFNTTGIDPFPTGALAFWKLSDITDSTPNGNDLTNIGSVPFVSGLIGDCAEFYGNGSNRLETNTLSSNFNPDGPDGEFTISIWVYPYTLSNYQAYIGGNQGSTFIIHTDGAGGVNCNEGQAGDAYVPTGLVTDQWQHIVFSKSLDGNSKIWLNGVQIYNDTTQNAQNYQPTTDATIGAFAQGTYPCNAKVDMAGLWNRELTQNEIDQLYNNGNGVEP